MPAAPEISRKARLPRTLAALTLVTLAGAFSGSASAQVRDVEAYKAVVLQNATALRCDNSDKFYKVAELAAGTIVAVDGESADWARVAYPPNVHAFVASDQVDFTAATKTAKLKEASKLKAPHLASGFEGSWKSLLARELPAGSELKVLDELKNKDGKVQGYRIAAPETARGFLTKASIRKATPEELAKAAGTPAAATSKPAATAAAPTTPSPTAPTTPVPTSPTPTPAAITPTAPAEGTPAAPQPEVIDLTQAPQPSGNQPTTIDQKSDPAATPVPASTPPSAPTDAAPKPPSAIDLEPVFQKVRREDAMTAEVDELMAAYQRLIAERPIGDRRRKQMEQRVEVLKFIQDYRDSRRKVEQANLDARQSRDEFQKKMNEYDLQRQYATVGLLMPSTVYDGSELPLMYRLQTVGGSVPRTLGYIKPTPELNLPSKIGVVVGVVGENKFDASLRLNVIEAVRVDSLQAAQNPIKVGN